MLRSLTMKEAVMTIRIRRSALIMVAIGILCIYMVEYNPASNWSSSFVSGKTNYSKQLFFAIFCSFIGIFILLMDSKVFTAFANISYGIGILLMIATFVIGKNINGSIMNRNRMTTLYYSVEKKFESKHNFQGFNIVIYPEMVPFYIAFNNQALFNNLPFKIGRAHV